MENHGIKTVVHEMKVNGHHLVERKTMERKQKNNANASDPTTRMTIITHSRSIDDRSYSYTVHGRFTEDERHAEKFSKSENFFQKIFKKIKKIFRVVETQMTQEEVEKFMEDWSNLWKPQKEADSPNFFNLHFD